MSEQFKVGDRVECIRDLGSIAVGEFVTIRDINHPKRTMTFDGYGSWYFVGDFKKVEPSPDPAKPSDPVEHPSHYTHGIEPIEVIESWGLNYRLGNALKYICRADHKGQPVQDLEKAAWYLNREIQKRKAAP